MVEKAVINLSLNKSWNIFFFRHRQTCLESSSEPTLISHRISMYTRCTRALDVSPSNNHLEQTCQADCTKKAKKFNIGMANRIYRVLGNA